MINHQCKKVLKFLTINAHFLIHVFVLKIVNTSQLERDHRHYECLNARQTNICMNGGSQKYASLQIRYSTPAVEPQEM